jgi:8-oxo-dGTP diphosphatase
VDGDVEIVLVHRPRYDDWSLPKGKLHDGETEAAAALREVEEETKLACRLGREVAVVSYVDPRGRPKTVRYWEMTTDEDADPTPADEVDDARWVRVDEAEALLTYAHDRDLVRRLEPPE